MRKNKFIKLIEHILVALPILMIVATTCYTIFNSNAKDSYSGASAYQEAQLKYQTNDVNSRTDYIIGNYYLLDYNTYRDNTMRYVMLFDDNIENSYEIVKYIGTYDLDGSIAYTNVQTSDKTMGDYLELCISDNSPTLNILSTDTFSTDDVVLNISTNTLDSLATLNTKIIIKFLSYNGFAVGYETPYDVLKELPLEYNEYISVETPITTLDKAFENSMSEFNNLGFNKINFTGFFEDIFFEGQPNVYLSFVNNYLNYMLFVECTFILPLVLYWFIHIGEHIVYKFEEGGFLK